MSEKKKLLYQINRKTIANQRTTGKKLMGEYQVNLGHLILLVYPQHPVVYP